MGKKTDIIILNYKKNKILIWIQKEIKKIKNIIKKIKKWKKWKKIKFIILNLKKIKILTLI